MSRKLWSREELILALDLYFKIPYSKIDTKRPEVIKLANLTNRSSDSITLRLKNFVACDPYHSKRGIKGMDAGIPKCKLVWDEFSDKKDLLIEESNKIRNKYSYEIDSNLKIEMCGNLK